MRGLGYITQKYTDYTKPHDLRNITQYYAVYAVYAEILIFTQILRSITQPNFITHPTRGGGASPPLTSAA